MAGDEVRLRLGTRGSPLALAQAHEARARLARAHGWADAAVAIVVIKTTGDAIQDRALAEAGGKGLFTKELDTALLDGAIDIAVHSAKDLPTLLPEGIALAGCLPRADVRDALVSRGRRPLAELRHGAVIGSASLRRGAQLRRLRPDLDVRLIRGNVETRLRRVTEGDFDATVLAMAGLQRLGLLDRVVEILDEARFLPAVGQGAIAIAARDGDAATAAALAPILDEESSVAVACERAFLGVLDGSCRTPIAGHAALGGGAIRFRGQLLAADGTDAVEVEAAGAAGEAGRIGRDAGLDLKGRASPALLDPARPGG